MSAAVHPDLVHARYARWDGVGEPFTVVPAAVPHVPGPGEVLVEIDLATVCGSDLHTVAGHRASPAPGVLGHEQVGHVVAVGPGVPARYVDGAPVVPGARVVWSVTSSCGACVRCRRDMPQKCLQLRKYGHEPLDEAAPLTGGFATHCVVLPGTAIVAVPDDVPDAVAGPASCATATVAAVLAAAGPVVPGARALVSGAGMLGLTAVAMLAQAGAHVLAVDPDAARRAQARRFGAAEVAPDGADAADVDVAVELSGAAEAVNSCLDALAVGGVAVLAGSVSPGPAVPLDPERLVRGLHRVVGVHNYRPGDLQAAVDFLAAHHRTYPFAELVGGRYRLDEIDEAVASARRGPAPRQAVVPGA
ncbi:zinc-binding dehydrogenase [Pseudonocardia sp. MH-G8]|uniref:zinc-binding dehydrogenase n=1 Tax=Pseudonocardia sp. MH-G8 TaxID=1854588 RepID=UPI000BA0E48E|nr:zinc-binding dehydrogenase [Pseudonocardia sp. MH-G8]OZM78074.1 alcohol dehydrogenase [Pseudonocardia sp. MH-G8]